MTTTRLDEIQQAAEVPETCLDCGRPVTESHSDFVNQWEPSRPELCYPHVNFGGEQLCAERTVERLRSRIATLEASLSAATARASELEGLFQQTHGCHWSWVHKVTESQARIAELEAALGKAEVEVALYRKGHEARGKILAAYRTGGRPSEKALADAADVAHQLGLIAGGKTNG